MKTQQYKKKKQRNPIARFMLEHEDYYRVRIKYKDKKEKKPNIKNIQEFIDDESEG